MESDQFYAYIGSEGMASVTVVGEYCLSAGLPSNLYMVQVQSERFSGPIQSAQTDLQRAMEVAELWANGKFDSPVLVRV